MNVEEVSVVGSIARENVAVADALAATAPTPAAGVIEVTVGGAGIVAATSNDQTNGASSDTASVVFTDVPMRAVYAPPRTSTFVGARVARRRVAS